MPQIGEIKRGTDIGYKTHGNRIWHTCIDCGKERWVILKKTNPQNLRCKSCAPKVTSKTVDYSYVKHGSQCSQWKGGVHKNEQGYVKVLLDRSSFFYPMVYKNGYILEHRLVMAKHLNRCLTKSEHIHHLNGIRDDNRIENLKIISQSEHINRTKYCNHCKLHKDIKILQWQNKELLEQIRQLNLSLMR